MSSSGVAISRNSHALLQEGVDAKSMNRDDPLVSVVTASFEALEGLKTTVESVRTQTCRDVEHIVIDGGSRDGTRQWLERQDDLAWLSEPDGGIADALNKGVAMARGRYLLVLQAEDAFLNETSLAMAVPHLTGDADIVSFDVLFERAAGPIRYRSNGWTRKTNFKMTIPHQGAFCQRRLFERIGTFDPTIRVAMDYDFFLRAHRAGARVETVAEVLARMPDTGISSQLDWPSLSRRFAEERRIHRAHCRGPAMRAIYAVYWPLYLAYRRGRHGIQALLSGKERA